jgi:hypothetical protein
MHTTNRAAGSAVLQTPEQSSACTAELFVPTGQVTAGGGQVVGNTLGCMQLSSTDHPTTEAQVASLPVMKRT